MCLCSVAQSTSAKLSVMCFLNRLIKAPVVRPMYTTWSHIL